MQNHWKTAMCFAVFMCEVVDYNACQQNHPSDLRPDILMKEFPSLFSSSLGIAKCNPYDVELSDTSPVRSPLFRRAPFKLGIFKQFVSC